MSYKGQPVPSTTYPSARAKVSDGKSVTVTVPENTTIVSQTLVLVGGFFGVAMQDVVTAAGETAELVITIEEAELETDQTNSSQTYAVGTPVFWNTATSKITETAAGNRFVGVVTNAKDAGGVVWFKLSPQANGMMQAAAQTDSTAADVPTMVSDFNSLLAKLRAANLIAQ
jgi:predicted RecA/RadA family phage recombinase